MMNRPHNEVGTTTARVADFRHHGLESGSAGASAGLSSPPVAWCLSGRVAPEATTQEVPVTATRFTIGRRVGHHLCLTNPTVSGDHAELLNDTGELYVRDLQSTNGTFLNGRRIDQAETLQDGDMLHFGTASFQVRRSSEMVTGATQTTDIADEALAILQFDRLMAEPAVVPHFQPIVRLADAQPVGYEVLARCRLLGLQTPDIMFQVAGALNSEAELSRLMRREGLRAGQDLTARSPLQLYLNTHPSELNDPAMIDSLSELRRDFPDVSLILEIHEAAVTSAPALGALRRQLTDLGVGLAYDDFGSGQARLQELADVPPDVIKFDIHLIHGLPQASLERRRMVQSLVRIARDLDVIPLAEGIETAGEAEVCYDLGFELAQGFYFGEPAPAENWPRPGC